MKSKKFRALCLAMALCFALSGCALMGSSDDEEDEEASVVTVEVQSPRYGDLTVQTDFVGSISPQEQVYVVPLVSGTVTETNYSVGDYVNAGDVLFKIDDEAAQLSMESAQASYNQVVASVNAATGGTRNLQDYQTENTIDTLEDNLDDVRDSIDSMKDQITDLEDTRSTLKDSASAAKTAAKTANDAYSSAQKAYDALDAELTPQITALEEENEALEASMITVSDDSDDADAAAAAEEANQAVQDAIDANQALINELKVQLSDQEKSLQKAASSADSAQGTYDALNEQIDTVQSGIDGLYEALDTANEGKQTIKDNLAVAQDTYDITKNQIYPETDATYDAQLQAAAVAIDSAQMQLDYYTITAPISGVIEAINVEVNQMAASGSSAYIISNKDTMTVTFSVAEAAKNALSVGDAITVERNDLQFTGTITEVGTMSTGGMFKVKASVYGAGDTLESGISVKVHADTQKESGKFIVPFDSLYFSTGDAYLYCVENGCIVKTSVTVGAMSDTEAVIEEGIDADSVIVTTWSSKLRDGAEVETIMAE